MASEEVMGQCVALRGDELLALESIYGNQVQQESIQVGSSDKIQLQVTIPVSLQQPTPVALETLATTTTNNASSSNVLPLLDLERLPALTAKIVLPAGYPLDAPPKIIEIRAPIPDIDRRSNWLSRKVLSGIGNKLVQMWREEKETNGEGAGVIWSWWEWVANGDFLTDARLLDDNGIRLFVPPSLAPSTFHTLLKTYNAKQLHSSFESTAFSCSICMENRKGKSCIRMPDCGCVFCTPCLSSCWSLAIEEGSIENVACPSIDCVKKRATDTESTGHPGIEPDLVESVVGPDLRARWLDLKDRRRAETDPSWTSCPRLSCQAAVPPPLDTSSVTSIAASTNGPKTIRLADLKDSKSSPAPANGHAHNPDASTSTLAPPEDRWARHRQCPKCQYSFCLYCSNTWHGPHTPCAFPQVSALVLEYLSYPEDSPARRAMEIRRGKANLERMVAQWREDEENKKWFESRTRACPGCGVRVEKSHGCNHMTCGRCHAHFCYRCGSSISPQDPYVHYRRPGSSCFEKLFDQEEIEWFERQATGDLGLDDLAYEQDAAAWAPVRNAWEW